VFVLTGGGAMHLNDSLGTSGMSYICCLHEQAVAVAALAYAQYKTDIGVGLVTTGPGGTNAITGVFGAYVESVPLLLLSGQVKTSDLTGDTGIRMRGVQEGPIVDIIKPITKYAITITEPSSIKYHLDKAIHIAREGRPGPVWLDIPLNVQSAMIDETTLAGYIPSSKENDLQIDEVISFIKTAKRPVIIGGSGIRQSGALNDFLQLIERLNIPVLLTWKAMDYLPEEHPLFMGRPGTVGQRAANFIQQNCDLLITIGARLDSPQIGFDQSKFAPKAKKIIVDIDPCEFKKFSFKVELPIVSDAKDFIKKLLNSSMQLPDNTTWLDKCRAWNQKYPVILPTYYEKEKYVSTYALVDTLSKHMTEEDIFIPSSSGMGGDISMQAFRIKQGQRAFSFPGIGSMGFCIPSSIGACIASDMRNTVCISGDGGFQMNIQELETVVRLKLPIKYFYLNNDAYASIRSTQNNYFSKRYMGSGKKSGVTLPDIESIASAYHLQYYKIECASQLEDIVLQALKTTKPVIIECMIDPYEVPQPKASSMIMDDGTAVSRPLEDLFPFLPRNEFEENMLIEV
jgi:acetolactate synthase-1/2/3 large subunit